MPEVSRFRGLIVTMYYGDPQRHATPHFHARYGEYQASIAIEPPAWLSGTLPRRQMQIVLGWAAIHGTELLDNWQHILDGEPVVKIEGI